MSRVAEIGTKGMARDQRERQILDVAVAEFADRGFGGASMSAVGERAGISKALIYQYFGSKDGLYVACLDHVGAGLVARIEAEMAGGDDSLVLPMNVLRIIFESLEPQRNVWWLLYDPTVPRAGAVAETTQGYRDRVTALARAGTERFLGAREGGDGLDVSLLSHFWMDTVHSLVVWWIDHPDQTATDMIERCTRMLDAMLSR